MEFLTFRVSETCKFHLIPGTCMFHSSEPLSSLWLEEVATPFFFTFLFPICVLSFCTQFLFQAKAQEFTCLSVLPFHDGQDFLVMRLKVSLQI